MFDPESMVDPIEKLKDVARKHMAEKRAAKLKAEEDKRLAAIEAMRLEDEELVKSIVKVAEDGTITYNLPLPLVYDKDMPKSAKALKYLRDNPDNFRYRDTKRIAVRFAPCKFSTNLSYATKIELPNAKQVLPEVRWMNPKKQNIADGEDLNSMGDLDVIGYPFMLADDTRSMRHYGINTKLLEEQKIAREKGGAQQEPTDLEDDGPAKISLTHLEGCKRTMIMTEGEPGPDSGLDSEEERKDYHSENAAFNDWYENFYLPGLWAGMARSQSLQYYMGEGWNRLSDSEIEFYRRKDDWTLDQMKAYYTEQHVNSFIKVYKEGSSGVHLDKDKAREPGRYTCEMGTWLKNVKKGTDAEKSARQWLEMQKKITDKDHWVYQATNAATPLILKEVPIYYYKDRPTGKDASPSLVFPDPLSFANPNAICRGALVFPLQMRHMISCPKSKGSKLKVFPAAMYVQELAEPAQATVRPVVKGLLRSAAALHAAPAELTAEEKEKQAADDEKAIEEIAAKARVALLAEEAAAAAAAATAAAAAAEKKRIVVQAPPEDDLMSDAPVAHETNGRKRKTPGENEQEEASSSAPAAAAPSVGTEDEERAAKKAKKEEKEKEKEKKKKGSKKDSKETAIDE